jgi:DNA-binding PadR family transcriptional regulator
MSHSESGSAQAALLRVLIGGDAEGPELIRKIRDWTEGRIALDELSFASTVTAAESAGLVERHQGAPDRRGGTAHVTWSLTPAGRASAVEILADSLTRKA